jgi:hypothetical protein
VPFTRVLNGEVQTPRPKKARQIKSKFKSMLIIFFDVKGIIHKKIVLAFQTVSSAYYSDFTTTA